MKKRFQGWYADEVQKRLKDVPVDQLSEVDLTAAIIKDKCTNWIISSWQALQEHVTINGFRKAGILDAITSVTED